MIWKEEFFVADFIRTAINPPKEGYAWMEMEEMVNELLIKVEQQAREEEREKIVEEIKNMPTLGCGYWDCGYAIEGKEYEPAKESLFDMINKPT
jgi:hypothetical protein